MAFFVHATIFWRSPLYFPTDITSLEDLALDKRGLYCWVGVTSVGAHWNIDHLFYTGKAFRQTLRERIKQPHTAYPKIAAFVKRHPEVRPAVIVGHLISSSLSRRTDELYSDVEGALIIANEPMFNIRCSEVHCGRSIEVHNQGTYFPLAPTALAWSRDDLAELIRDVGRRMRNGRMPAGSLLGLRGR